MRTAIVIGAAALASGSIVLGSSNEIQYPNFSSTTGLQLNASAAVVNTADGKVLRVVPASGGQAGSVFSTTQLHAAAFSTFFTFRMTNPGGPLFDGPDNTVPGADGLVFVVQPNSSGAGSAGQGIGYGGIGNSVGVEFDTWQNLGNHDPNSNHLGIDVNGVVDHGAGSPYTLAVSPLFDDGNLWYAWVDYDGTTLTVSANQSNNRPTTPMLSRALDLSSILGGDTAFIGFTGGTGSDYENVDLLNWEYRQEYDPIGPNEPPTAVPLPAAVWSGSAGLLLMGLAYRRLRRADNRILQS